MCAVTDKPTGLWSWSTLIEMLLSSQTALCDLEQVIQQVSIGTQSDIYCHSASQYTNSQKWSLLAFPEVCEHAINELTIYNCTQMPAMYLIPFQSSRGHSRRIWIKGQSELHSLGYVTIANLVLLLLRPMLPPGSPSIIPNCVLISLLLFTGLTAPWPVLIGTKLSPKCLTLPHTHGTRLLWV